MKILAIETSCDETGIALVEGEKTAGGFAFSVLKHALLSQAQLHAEYGGVYPNLAKREHQKNLPVLFEQFKDEEANAIAVTQGPGLEPALWTGIEFAKKLAADKNLPLLPTNHMEGHLISSLAQTGSNHFSFLQKAKMMEIKNVQFPVLGLLISGGHTEFVLMREWFKYEIIGETLDDAVGEAFDKVARMLGLAYPGGPEISRLASFSRGETSRKKSVVSLPRPMLQADTCDVSFSGLKTAALYALRDMGGIQTLSAEQIADFAREFEDAVTEILLKKTARAMEQTGAKTFVIGGGVAANAHLRSQLQKLIEKDFSYAEFRLPELSITGDNAIMIAEAALARRLNGLDDATKEDFRAEGQLSIVK
ncbi:MAG TPA: tRNA (adenosine(37)-N6)-threonylcarbamoyltransferase complex transferase subunit TsaD [Candidatus Paceibacterota bacterium]|nr:tRNA (adenosine(37)-N6)-threonylcarbamoyltransferase complex transferase subunit TsaD [Candidatus Paceibacterota bacterium]